MRLMLESAIPSQNLDIAGLSIPTNIRGRGGLVVRCRLRDRRVPGSKPDSTKDPPCMWTRCMCNHTYGVKSPPADAMRKFGEGAPAQVSSSSSDCGSKYKVRPKIVLVSLQNGPFI
ncbi:hypothetical protein AVEN_164753-1 [Araneus ventricosus]|uniref:Uncharacterized protein n=1 Tax=Araneus ventricosus TaxID=182803 RepID=A0A4Y2V2W7_ARAVE|nr:hypothetical protein AVEN_164753-1 [Araneus ventricosus]